MKNKSIESIMELIDKSKDKAKSIKREIKYETEKLQDSLQKEKNKIELQKEELLKIMNDKNEHIIKRLWVWVFYAKKDEDEYLIDDGPLQNRLFEHMERYQEYDVIDTLLDYLTYDMPENNDIYFEKKWNEGLIESFDRINDEERNVWIDVINDAIKQNVSSFKCDW